MRTRPGLVSVDAPRSDSESRSRSSESPIYANIPNPFNFTSGMAARERTKMFEVFLREMAPTRSTTVIDVGVTSARRVDSNFFENNYPYPANITATGIEDAKFLEDHHPGLRFVLTDGDTLPFPDKTFDLGVSFAVLEHVGSRQRQREFIAELCRVSRRVFLTTPNRWFPVEFHTLSPLIHWLPPAYFRRILRAIGQDFYAQEANLNLMSHDELVELFPRNVKVTVAHHKLFGFVSNLMAYTDPT